MPMRHGYQYTVNIPGVLEGEVFGTMHAASRAIQRAAPDREILVVGGWWPVYPGMVVMVVEEWYRLPLGGGTSATVGMISRIKG